MHFCVARGDREWDGSTCGCLDHDANNRRALVELNGARRTHGFPGLA